MSDKGRYLGTGIYSELSKIRVRILSRNTNDKFDEIFWRRRIKYAWDYRRAVMGKDISACRNIFGESDHFPGLTVDLFGDIAVTQTLSVGMERLKPMIFPLIYDVLANDRVKLRGIFERNDVAIRSWGNYKCGENLLGAERCKYESDYFTIHNRVTEKTPPIFMCNTSDDPTVNVINALAFGERLRDNNVPFELHIYPHGPHGIGLAEKYDDSKHWSDLAADWINRNI